MIELKNLTAGYGNFDVISGMNLSINNENISIIGPNGSGKTTLLRVLSGVLPYKGSVSFDGKELSHFKGKALAKKIAMLSQITVMYFNYSVMETVLMGRYAHSKGIFSSISSKDREIAAEAIKIAGLSGLENKGINTLSGGQIQRVFLAKVICQDPQIVLLDEPTNHLDLSYQAELVDFLANWSKSENKMLIGVLHDLNLAAKLSDRMLLLNKGAVAKIGSVQDVLASEKLKEVYGIDVKNYMIDNLKYWENLG